MDAIGWRYVPWLFAVGLVASAQASGGPSTLARPVTVQVSVSGPTIIAFLPPEASQPDVEGAGEAVAHIRFAIADTRRCMGVKAVRFEIVYADRVVVKAAHVQQTFDVGSLGQGIGALLAEPGRPATVVHTEVGPSSLAHRLPQAAFEYWRLVACRRE